MPTFQELVLRLQMFWSERGCALLQPYDLEVGAGTSHTATFLRALGPEPWRAAYVQPSRRPKDGRYGENPNRLQHYYQFQVVLKPSPLNILDLYLASLQTIGIDPQVHDVRFVEDDWENPTLGAWGLGWEVWLNGMEITQFTYFQQVGGIDCNPIMGEITYGLERLAMYLQEKSNVFDLIWTPGVTYRDVYHQNEVEQSAYNFEHSNATLLFEHFGDYESEAKRLMDAQLALPAYEMVLKAAHTFNLLDARGAISVTERAGYIGRIRALSRAVALAYFQARERLGFPMMGGKCPAFSSNIGVCERASPLASWTTGEKTGMSGATLLVELRTEELPPKALQRLGAAFADGIVKGLRSRKLIGEDAIVEAFSTPRRLAVTISSVLPIAPDQPFVERLMPANVGLDRDGRPSAALMKKLAAKGLSHLDPSQLTRESDGKADQLVYRNVSKGHSLSSGLQMALEETIQALPIPKMMSYQLADGQSTVRFVRPAHGLVALHGADIVPVSLLGLAAGRLTLGHRFQSIGAIELATAGEYEGALSSRGHVIASFGRRRAEIDGLLRSAAAKLGVSLGDETNIAPLLDEVTALVELPAVYRGEFEAEFLAVPPECLILTMRQNQKYFPLFDSAGRLTNAFLIVSNMKLANPKNIVEGNQRVVRPRLADARFFFETDRKTRLADRVPQLSTVLYHNKLGDQLQRTGRVRALAGAIALRCGADAQLADRAALCAKADLLTGMVAEFPELQGVMGRYYALADGEDAKVAAAIEQHYRPRFAGDKLPESDVGVALALADKLETLAGLFGIGQQPSGDKDPFALRRHALGVVRMLIEPGLKIPLANLVAEAFSVFPPGMLADAEADLEEFIFERLRGYLRDSGYTANEIESVLCMRPSRLDQIPGQLAAVRSFLALPEAQSLAAANKRVANILKQAQTRGEAYGDVAPAAFREPSERVLFESLRTAAAISERMLEAADYAGYLQTFAALKVPVDAFFESVMVMVEDREIRKNRLALLAELRLAMNRFSDISKLAA